MWVAIKGVVYDVTSNELYRPGGGYCNFAGKDASIAFGTMEFDDLKRRGWLKVLNHEQLECMDEWVVFYKDRYKVVGYLADEYK